jgi:predicted ATP-dependent serine protease
MDTNQNEELQHAITDNSPVIDFIVDGHDLLAELQKEAVQADVEEVTAPKEKKQSVLTLKTAPDWVKEAEKIPIPNLLFDKFWVEGELCFLVADTNLGKSILAVQISDSLSKGIAIAGFELGAAKQKVIYCDFELSKKQFQRRYTVDFQNPYDFDLDFLRVEPDFTTFDGQDLETAIIDSIEQHIQETNSRVIIVDNITYLGQENEKAHHALALMKDLNRLKKQYELSILVLCHTPKIYVPRPLSVNDIMGSKNLANFCDAAFGIGRAQTSDTRYLKQLKTRSTELVYGSDNVILCEVEKPDNFLQFRMIGKGTEWDMLKTADGKTKQDKVARAKELKAEGKTVRQIAQELGCATGSVSNYLNS